MQTVRFPGWRTMTSAQRRNAKMDAMFERARQQGHTTFNAYAVEEVEPGLFQSVFPTKEAALSKLHDSEADAWAYIREARNA